MKLFITITILAGAIICFVTFYAIYAFYTWDFVPVEVTTQEEVETVKVEVEPSIDPAPITPETPRTMLEIQ